MILDFFGKKCYRGINRPGHDWIHLFNNSCRVSQHITKGSTPVFGHVIAEHFRYRKSPHQQQNRFPISTKFKQLQFLRLQSSSHRLQPTKSPSIHPVAMAPPRRALIAITSAKAVLYPNEKETGLFVTEALHPYNVFKAAGFRVDFVSETGNYYPDWLSLQADWLKGEDKTTWEDRDSDFRAKLDDLLRPGDVKASKYGIFFASAGHASLLDYPNAKGLQAIAAELYKGGGIVAAV
jgi:hypothetical protein